MAWVQQLPSGRWRGLYRDHDGKPRSAGTFAHKPEARRRAAEHEAKARRGVRTNPAGHRMRWGEWADQWFPTRGVEAPTQRTSAAKLNKHVRPRWANVRLGDISRIDVQRWVNELARDYAASTVRQCYYLLSQSLDAAVAEGHLDLTPCREIDLPSLPRGQERFLERAEVDRILFQLDGVYRVLAELLVGTGMRISEACGLHRDRLDLDRQRVEVVHVYSPTERVMRPYTKNKKTRTVPIGDELADRLAHWLDTAPDAGGCGYPHDGDQCRAGLVLPSPHGRAVDPHNFTNRHWYRAVDDAGVGRVRVHDLRHTYASWLLQRGIPIERVRDLLGHGSVTVTERYAHLIPDDHDDVLAALNGGRVAKRVAEAAPTSPDEFGRRPAAHTPETPDDQPKRPRLTLVPDDSERAG